jgi:hypothetical protein
MRRRTSGRRPAAVPEAAVADPGDPVGPEAPADPEGPEGPEGPAGREADRPGEDHPNMRTCRPPERGR